MQTGELANADSGLEISWTASEYIAHQKSAGWYVLLGLGASLLAAVVYLMTQDMMSTAVIIVVCVIFGYGASRQPRTLRYGLTHRGIMVGEKFYPYTEFKSFAVMEEDAIYSIQLLPMRRFMPGLTIYYPPDQENQILSVLGDYLPHEERAQDMIDKLARKLRF